MKKLELNKIYDMLENKCVSYGAKKMVSSLTPCYDTLEVLEKLQETTQAKIMIESNGTPDFYETVDIQNHIKRAELSGILSNLELLDIALVLKNISELLAYHTEAEDKSFILDKYFTLLTGDKLLCDKIYNAISSENELFDTASSELFEIRRKIRSLNAKVREYLNKMISKENKFLQENLITIRNDRFVIPVKTEHKGDVKGLIHDVSASGNTLFIEPTEVLEANNELRILLDDEKREIERILKMFTKDVLNIAKTLTLDYSILIELEFIFAKAKLSIMQNAIEPHLSDDGYTNLINAVHPLLDPKTAVPVSIEIGGEFDTLIITGPNTGGKTVCLKTLGLLTLMASLGLHIPCESGSIVYIGGKIYADIGDEQSINESLSTFSSHIKNIINILEKCEKNDLLLFDELGSGTDPLEGSALAISIIEYARKLSCKVLATTHYTDIKLYALETDGVENASFEFDFENLKPTYKLIVGAIGKSNAFEISSKLGLDSSIIENARKKLSTEHNKFENLIMQIENDKIETQNMREESAKMREIAKNALARAEIREKEISDKYDAMLQKAKDESSRIINQAKRATSYALNEIEEIKKQSKEDIKSVNLAKARSEIYKNFSDAEMKEVKLLKNINTPKKGDITIGMQIRLLKTNTIATVISLPDKQNKVLCKAGILKINASLDEIEIFKTTQKPQNNKPKTTNTRALRNTGATLEVDIRGKDSLEGVALVDLFISNAILSNIEQGYIIHGKGTGALRQAVREHLKRHNKVKSFRPGAYGEGEDGVTVITLK